MYVLELLLCGSLWTLTLRYVSITKKNACDNIGAARLPFEQLIVWGF